MRETIGNPSRRTLLASGVAVAATLAAGSGLTSVYAAGESHTKDSDASSRVDVIIVGADLLVRYWPGA